ncbi:691_t:CDS:1, partial [Paraglomus brasilianum]
YPPKYYKLPPYAPPRNYPPKYYEPPLPPPPPNSRNYPPMYYKSPHRHPELYDENYLHYSRVDDRYGYGYESDPRKYYIDAYDPYDYGYGYYYRPPPSSVVHEIPKWNDVKNSKSYLRRRVYTGSDIKRESKKKIPRRQTERVVYG